MKNSKLLIEKLLRWILPFIERDCRGISEEERIMYMHASTIGFGISYQDIYDAAAEMNLLDIPKNN